TQALCPVAEIDSAEWWAGWFEYQKRNWPVAWSPRFPGVVRRYVADLLARKYPPGGPPRPSFATLRAALAAAIGLWNPERWARHRIFPVSEASPKPATADDLVLASPPDEQGEIGRASCRERVESWGGGGAIR